MSVGPSVRLSIGRSVGRLVGRGQSVTLSLFFAFLSILKGEKLAFEHFVIVRMSDGPTD